MAKQVKFPKTLYARRENDDGTVYYVTDTDVEALAAMGEKTRVGVYELVGVEEVEGIVERRPVKKT